MELPLLCLGERGDLVRHPDRPTAFGYTVDDFFTLKNLLFACSLEKYAKYKRFKFLEPQEWSPCSLETNSEISQWN